jgi:hypothetical protein
VAPNAISRCGQRGDPAHPGREDEHRGAVDGHHPARQRRRCPGGLHRRGQQGEGADQQAALEEAEEQHEPRRPGPGDGDQRGQEAAVRPGAWRLVEVAEGSGQHERGQPGHHEHRPPGDELGHQPGGHRRDGRAEGDPDHQPGELALAARGVHGVTDVDHPRGVGRTEEGAPDAPGHAEQQRGRRERRGDRGEAGDQHGEPDGPHQPHPVGDQPPDRLAQAVGQEVGAGRLDDRRQRDVEVGGDRDEHRWHREPVDGADERIGLQEPDRGHPPGWSPQHRPTVSGPSGTVLGAACCQHLRPVRGGPPSQDDRDGRMTRLRLMAVRCAIALVPLAGCGDDPGARRRAPAAPARTRGSRARGAQARATSSRSRCSRQRTRSTASVTRPPRLSTATTRGWATWWSSS